MSEENKALIRRWFEEVWNKGRAEAIDEMLHAECVMHGLSEESGKPLRGPEEFRAFHRTFREAFPDIIVTVDDVITEGEQLAARCTVRGRHTGDSLGFAASQKPILINGIGFARVEDGKFVEVWNSFDFMSMYRQIGVM